ncbi:hypothetical protein Vafri_20167 [Volvox africanus]|uniref:Uncharacterized protein n=1 Tax=Volvox africanus TaxID=51714 RepID=A0A8J4FDN2_9CHLO|nr:hypothetical protein Vafri_20167 [Volvox africanus]
MYQDASTGAIAFDGNTCFGYSSQDLPSSWNNSAEAAFTAVWIGSFTLNTSKPQMLMTLSRTKNDYYKELYWESTLLFPYDPELGFGFNIQSSNMPAAPTDMWTLEAIVRPSGAASVSYYRYNKQRPYLQSWIFSGQPSKIFPDSFTIGADILDNGKFLNGKVSVILIYNRALSRSELVQLSSFYANRFSWSKPTCPGYQQLPNNLRPEVVNLDACIGVIVQSGLDVAQAGASPTPPTTSAVRAWLDAEGGNSKGGGLPVQLNFTGNCLMYQDASTGAIAFDGNTCFGYSSQDLPSSWNNSAEAAFTAVWIGSFTLNTSKPQMLMTLSRTKNDYYKELYWESTLLFPYDPELGFGFNIQSSNMPAAPTDMWTLEAIVRPSGAASVSYYRYNKQRPYLQSWIFSGQPSKIFPDSFTIGADILDNGKFLNGKVSVILIYNRALSRSELVQLSSFYANRFSWSKPTCPGYQQLPNNLRPEVVNLDACIGVIVQSGLDVAQAGASPTPPTTSAVRAWLDAEGGNSKGGSLPVQLNFTGNCLMYQDASTGAIAFDGNTCFGYSSQDLPSSWNNSAEAAFTAVWIGSFTLNTSKPQMLMTLSRTKNDYYKELYWESTLLFPYDPELGFGFNIQSSNMPAAPTDMWTLEAIVRPSGAASVSYYRYNKQRPYLQSWIFSGQPSKIFPDSFTIGADILDNGKFLNGKVSVILIYNRALSRSELVQLSSFYANRFSWSKPST